MEMGTKSSTKKENNAEAKFDALFGDPEPEQKQDNNHFAQLKESLAPSESENTKNNRKDSRKDSLVMKAQVSRKKFDKKVLLSRFKQCREIDMNVFEKQSLLDHCDLFITSDKKKQEIDAFEALEDELEETKDCGNPGQPPENLKPTQGRPDHALQQYGGAGRGKAAQRGGYQQ